MVLACLFDAAAVEAVVTGPHGLQEAIGPGQVFIDMITNSPPVSRQLAALLADKGADMLDAAVSRLRVMGAPIGLDPKKLVSRAYGTNALPSSFILNSEGQVIAAAKGERDWFSEAAVHYIEIVTPGIPVKSPFLSSGVTGGKRVSWEGSI